MVRKTRKHYRGAQYHVMLRGNNRQIIFNSTKDYYTFLNYLETMVNKYACKVHLFCLMTNHIHLLMEVGEIPLAKIMQNLTANFTQHMNKRYDRVGHLFQGRYLAKQVSSKKYFLELCYYIHMNPINANITQTIDDYPWSSHVAYNEKKEYEWLTKIDVLKSIHKSCKQKTMSLSYQYFLEEWGKKNIEVAFCAFGEFGELLCSQAGEHIGKSKRDIDLKNVSLDKIIEETTRYYGLPKEKLASESLSKQAVKARTMIGYIGHYKANYKLKDIAMILDSNPLSFSRSMHNRIMIMKENKTFEYDLGLIQLKIMGSEHTGKIEVTI